MNNLIQNYELILKELTNICSHITSSDFFKKQEWALTHPLNVHLLEVVVALNVHLVKVR
ncbi:hypothetical protein EZS27_037499 [termite gut metagenome]|uniref:Uncharacterized protein n=1 Tax=termite gut metagenome TaxID=433724 RepID=A0A5J4PPC6_9ZZZZ